MVEGDECSYWIERAVEQLNQCFELRSETQRGAERFDMAEKEEQPGNEYLRAVLRTLSPSVRRTADGSSADFSVLHGDGVVKHRDH